MIIFLYRIHYQSIFLRIPTAEDSVRVLFWSKISFMSIFFLQIYCTERRMMMGGKFGKEMGVKISEEWKKTQENKNISNVETKDDGTVLPLDEVPLIINCPVAIAFLKSFPDSFRPSLHLQSLDLETEFSKRCTYTDEFELRELDSFSIAD